VSDTGASGKFFIVGLSAAIGPDGLIADTGTTVFIWIFIAIGAYAVIHGVVFGPAIFFKQKVAGLGPVVGKTDREIEARLGRPTDVSATPDGGRLLQWQRSGYSLALKFDANGTCLGVVGEHSTSSLNSIPSANDQVAKGQAQLGPGESLTPGGFVRQADGTVIVPQETKGLFDAWAAAGGIKGMTMAEIAQRVGNCDPVSATQWKNGYSNTWSRPGYRISVLFGPDNRAIGILNGSERLG